MGYGPIYHLSSRTLYRVIDKETSETGVSTRLNSSEPGWFSSTSFSPIPTRTTSRRRRIRSDFFVKRWAYPLSTFPLWSTKAFGRAVQPCAISWMDFPPFSHRLCRASPLWLPFPTWIQAFRPAPATGDILPLTNRSFRQLNSFRFFYISPKTSHFQSAEQRFRAAVKEPLESDVSAELLRYFEIRRKWEDREYIVPVTNDLEFLSETRRRFHCERFDGLSSAWHSGHLTEEALRQEFCQVQPQHTVYFETVYVGDHRSYLERNGNRGERPMKGAVHPYVHRSVHPAGERKC